MTNSILYMKSEIDFDYVELALRARFFAPLGAGVNEEPKKAELDKVKIDKVRGMISSVDIIN